jgi:hypothetical protein
VCGDGLVLRWRRSIDSAGKLPLQINFMTKSSLFCVYVSADDAFQKFAWLSCLKLLSVTCIIGHFYLNDVKPSDKIVLFAVSEIAFITVNQ